MDDMNKKLLLSDELGLQEKNIESSEKDGAADDFFRVGTTTMRGRDSGSKGMLLIFVMLALAGSAFISWHLVMSNSRDGFTKFITTFKGNSAQMMQQEVKTNGINNIVGYIVTISPTETLTVLDDFSMGIQIMKSMSPYSEICYLSLLDKDSYVRPAEFAFGPTVEKGHKSRLFETSEKPLDDHTILGLEGEELCRGLPVFWIYPVEMAETDLDEIGDQYNWTSSAAASESETKVQLHSRSKRNIRSCSTSCCWLVCCCDVHHFTWEAVEHFSCNHICNKCTSEYKSIIRKLC